MLTYSARGFGTSGGLIHLDAPEYEVADASKLIDYLATQAVVRKDARATRESEWPVRPTAAGCRCCSPAPIIGSTR